MRILKLLKEVGKDFVMTLLPYVIFIVTILGTYYLINLIPDKIQNILVVGFISIASLTLLFILIIAFVIYIKRKWNEVK